MHPGSARRSPATALVAIANHRLVDFDGDHVGFRWRDYADGNKLEVMTLTVAEFLRRFLLHTLPREFVRLRHHGILGRGAAPACIGSTVG